MLTPGFKFGDHVLTESGELGLITYAVPTSAGQFVHVAWENRVESKDYANNLRIRHLETAPGKVVAGEGWKERMKCAVAEYRMACEAMDIKVKATRARVYESKKVLHACEDEVTILPAPLKTKQDPDENNLITVFDDDAFPLVHVYPKDAMRIASALIAAATQPQKGKG